MKPLMDCKLQIENCKLRIAAGQAVTSKTQFSICIFQFSIFNSCRLALTLARRVAILAVLAACALSSAHPAAIAQDSPPDDLNAKSLPLRTALHQDPTLVSPLEQLLSIYRGAGRADQLIGIYRAHVAQYPNDVSARTVLVRLLTATGGPEAVRAARGAVAQFPQDAYLHYVLYEILRGRQEPEALDQLDRAIELQTRPGRKIAWIDLLLPVAIAQDRQDLAKKHLLALAALVDAPQQRLEVARRMIKYKFFKPALELLEKKGDAPPAPETMVSIELQAAAAEVGLKKTEAAGARLDRLLAKLTADYWRRGEIVRRRLALVQSQAERQAMIAAARKQVEQNPRDEAAVLDLAQVLVGLQLRREALEVLFEAGRRLPKSAQIERRTLELLDRLRDSHGREKYLAQRIRQQPQRPDLVLLHVKTLYLLGRPKEALAELTGAVDAMKSDEKGPCLLETARFLRRSMLLGDATELFRRVIQLQPARLDVRRELAETYLAMGDRQRARGLFRNLAAKQADLENLLDLVQFMIDQELLTEARAAIGQRLQEEKENLDLRVLLLSVERRLGNLAAGEKLIAEGRVLADTGARYRLWLEAAVAFHEDFDSLDAFLEAEQARLDQDPKEWTTRRLERRLAFAEIAARSGREKEAAAMLQSDLEDDPPRDSRIRLRRQLVAILEKDPAQAAAVQQELEGLAKEDQQFADEYRARLALMHSKARRQDLVVALLDKIDVSRIRDPAILSALRPLYTQHPDGQQLVLPILRRLTVLNPTDRTSWENWLTALAVTGNESGLRSALRRLLAGVEKMPLSDQTRTLLESHLADSYWRDIGRRLVADEPDASLSEALIYLDAVEPVAQSDQQWLWIAWIRAYLLSRLGRKEAFEEALGELQRVAARIVDSSGNAASGDAEQTGAPGSPTESPGSPTESPPTMLRIAFPDGLSISFDHASKLLSAAEPPRRASRAGPRQGPLPEFRVKWTYQTDPQTAVTAVVPLGSVGGDSVGSVGGDSVGERTLICDAQGNAYCLDATTGKLLWQRPLLPAIPQPQAASGGYSSNSLAHRLQQIQMYRQMLPQMPPAQRAQAAQEIQRELQRLLAQLGVSAVPLADGKGRFYVPGTSQVSCHAADDGRLLWQADVGDVGASPPVSSALGVHPYVSIFLYGENLLTYEPVSGTVTRIDPGTGKIVWDGTFAPEKPPTGIISWHNSGASLCGHRLLVYGTRTAIVDLPSGQIQWSFEPWRVRKFPVELRDPSIQTPTATTSPLPAYLPGYSRYSVTSSAGYPVPPPSTRFPGQPTPPAQFVSYLQTNSFSGLPPGGVRLAAPAVAWASNLQQGMPRRACLTDRRLLLFDQSGLQIVHTDLPLAGKRVEAAGQLIGLAGRTACLLSGSQLQFVDLTDGSVKQCDLQEIAVGTGQSAGSLYPLLGLAPIQATIDGSWVYATGPGGILCVNAITARRAFKADWPADLAPATPATPTTPTVATGPYPPLPNPYGPGYYPPPGVYGPGYSPPSTSIYQGIPGVHAPTISRVDRGVLYATATPNHVVALTQRSADGQ